MTADDTWPVTFPSRQAPEDGASARLLGLYPQSREGLWMQRVKVLGGVLTGGQWRALSRAADFSAGAPLHLTTRQDVELHDLAAGDVPRIQSLLREAGLSGLGACGDTVRNITVCPCSGTRSGLADLLPLARLIQRELSGAAGVFALPRKFKISLSACPEGCGQPWINDLGLVAVKRSGEWGFRVIAGGSLGPRPGTGMTIRDWLAADDVLPLAAACLRVFAGHGDRSNRSAARLRHVRQRMGDQMFADVLNQALAAERSERSWPMVQVAEPEVGLDARAVLTFPGGNVTPEQGRSLADLSEHEGLAVRIDTSQRVMVFSGDAGRLHRAIAGHHLLADAMRSQPAIVACPGRRWCRRALTDTMRMSELVREALADSGLPVSVRISGCPNHCAQSAVAEIGLVGVRVAGRDGYHLMVGGGMGRNDRLAGVVARSLTPEQAAGELLRRLEQPGGESRFGAEPSE